jgi:hypothetical protein
MPKLLAALLLAVVAACSPNAVPSPRPSPVAIASPATSSAPIVPSPSPGPAASEPATEPSAGPIDEPMPTPDPCTRKPDDRTSRLPLSPGSAIRVSVAELNLRTGPCLAATRATTLKQGKVMIVGDWLDGPFRADGYSWYSVLFPVNLPNGNLPKLPEQWFPDGTDTDGGWIAASSASNQFVTPVAPRCPATPDLQTITAMLPAERLGCFYSSIVLEGTFGCGGCGATGGPVAKPAWLADTFEFDQIRARWGDEFEFRPIGIHFPPNGPKKPPEGSVIRVTVHVDDPASTTCSFDWAIADPPYKVPESAAVAWCRERFVVEHYQVIGTDPSFPPMS